ncbi:MAG: chemotaxis protein CheC [Anaerolineaceae bacterium]|jgi:chemotaxis protein CheC
MKQSSSLNEEWINSFQQYASEGIRNAAKGFSTMLGENLIVREPSFRQVSIGEIPKLLGGPETEAVGIYLRAEGDVSGQIMLVIPLERALQLVDMLLDLAPGTTTGLGTLERSALGEIGNLTASYFLNSLSQMSGFSARPSPPAVMVDMVGAIMDIIIATCGGSSDFVLLMQTTFICKNRSIETSFWVVPDPYTLEVLSTRA